MKGKIHVNDGKNKPLTKKERKEIETTFLNLAQRLGFQKMSITCGELFVEPDVPSVNNSK